MCGGRNLWISHDEMERQIFRACDGIVPRFLIQGGASGADFAAKRWANGTWPNVKVLEFKADWETHGKAAGPIRNSRMLDVGRPDVVLAFWDGNSSGTGDMVRRSIKAGLSVLIVPPEDREKQ